MCVKTMDVTDSVYVALKRIKSKIRTLGFR